MLSNTMFILLSQYVATNSEFAVDKYGWATIANSPPPYIHDHTVQTMPLDSFKETSSQIPLILQTEYRPMAKPDLLKEFEALRVPLTSTTEIAV